MIYQFKYIQKNILAKTIRITLYSLVLLFFIPRIGNTFNKHLSPKTQGENFPHILKSNNFSLNARNVKVLKSQGSILWLGTSIGSYQI